jgi:microcystin degradation protein MlrC
VAQVSGLGALPNGGEFALLRNGHLDILVLDRRVTHLSPDLLDACGCDLASVLLLALKGGDTVAHMFSGLVGKVISCECPGPSHPDLLQLPYNFVPAVRRAVSVDDRHAAGLAADVVGNALPRRRSDERRGGAAQRAVLREGVHEA